MLQKMQSTYHFIDCASDFKIILKNFMQMSKQTFFEMNNKCFDEIENDIYENDGLIFTPIDVGGNHYIHKKQ